LECYKPAPVRFVDFFDGLQRSRYDKSMRIAVFILDPFLIEFLILFNVAFSLAPMRVLTVSKDCGERTHWICRFLNHLLVDQPATSACKRTG